MSVVVTNTINSRTSNLGQVQDPTIKLADALVNFEAILSDQQRLIFRGNLSKPAANDVIAFVSRIDAGSKTRGRKCVAPRLCTFLERTAQFAGVVDTFIQANPTIAALLWGGVKTALLAASNIASYFDKVTSMVMKISRTAPTYQRFGELYPSCVELQAALCDYYAIVVNMFTKVVEVSQRSTISQILSPVLNPFEIEFKNVLDGLLAAKDNVDLEISFAAQKSAYDETRLAQIERKENRLHRRIMSQFQAEWKAGAGDLRIAKHSRHVNKLRCDIRNNLCPLDHMKPWRQAKEQHFPGTVEWFPTDDSFHQWHSDPQSSILWCCGKLGSGKTVFVSNVITWLLDHLRAPTHLVSYFFCRSDDAETLTARNIIGSICKQLLDITISHLMHGELTDLLQQTESLSTMEVVCLMLSKLEDTTCYIIIDGLDECEDSEIAMVAKALAPLMNSTKKQFHILCSGRLELETSLLKSLPPKYRLSLTGDLVDADIEYYITETLERYLEEERLVIGDPKLISEIVMALRSGANGMFLWARLLIEELCYCPSDSSIREALADLPSGLFEIYERKLDMIERQPANRYAIKGLSLCCVLRRALTRDEMRELLTLELGQSCLQTDRMVNDTSKLISVCRGLLQMDEQEDTIHFIHHSVKQFLTAGAAERSPFVQEEATNISLGGFCLTYLNFREFDQQLIKRQPTTFGVDALAVSRAMTGHDRQTTVKIAKKLLRLKGIDEPKQIEVQVKPWQSISGSLNSMSGFALSTQYHFLSYARDHWIFHLGDLCVSQNPSLWATFCNFVEKQEQAQQRTKHFFLLSENCEEMRRFAFEHDHAALLRYSFARSKVPEDEACLVKLLARSSAKGKHRLRRLLLKELMPKISNDCRNEMDHDEFIRLILNARVPEGDGWIYPDIMPRLLKHVLTAAIVDDQPNIIMQLHECKTFDLVETDAWKLFVYSVERGMINIVRGLVQKHNLDLKDDLYCHSNMTALQLASIRGQTEMAVQLVKLGASVSPHAHARRFSPLAAAAWHGDVYLAETLIDSGAQVNSTPDCTGLFTPLAAAALNQQVAMVEYLLKEGADPNYCSGGPIKKTALELACEGRTATIIQKLLIAGAKIDDFLSTSAPIYGSYQVFSEAITAYDLKRLEVLFKSRALNYVGLAEDYQNSDTKRVHLKLIDLAVSLYYWDIVDLILEGMTNWVPCNQYQERAIRESLSFDFGRTT